jgi:hypothetical protein
VVRVVLIVVWRASQRRGVEWVAVWGEVRGTKVRGTKVRGRKWRRRREGRVGGDCVREASFPTKY